MSFAALSGAAVLAGIAVLAALLWLLQRLRVRHREVVVPTMLFWRKALEESRARVLVRRFRHPWAYVLLLAIAALLWLLAADPRQKNAGALRRVYVVDASAAMAAGGRFERAWDAVQKELGGTEGATVVVSAGRPRVLLAPGESPRLLDARRRAAMPEATPPAVDALVAEIAAAADPRAATEIVVAAATPLDAVTRKSLPAGVRVRELVCEAAADPRDAFAIVALGVAESATGAWTTVDVDATIVASTPEPALRVTLDGRPLAADVAKLESSASGLALRLRDLPAAGGVLEIAGPGDEVPNDDRAAIVLPSRPLIRVSIAAALDASLRPVLEADPAVTIVAGGADVEIVESVAEGAARPALAFVAGRPGGADFLVEGPGDGAEALRRVFGGIDRATIARLPAADDVRPPEPVRAEARPTADSRRIQVASDLLGDGASFVRVDAWPVFVAQSIRWLAGFEPLVAESRAGRPLAGVAALRDAAGRVLDAAGERPSPPRAGSYRAPDGRPLEVALADPASSAAFGGTSGAIRPASGAASASAWNEPALLGSLLGVLAFLALGAEWVLVRKGRVP